MPSGKSAAKFAEPLLLALFLSLLGYLFLTTAPEKALQTASVRPAPSTPQAPSAAETAHSTAPVRDDFGFTRRRFQVKRGHVRRHQTFADLLTNQGVEYATAVELAEKARPVFDVRHLQAGKPYRVYRQDGQAHHFVYQRDPVHYVAFQLQDSLAVRTGERPVTTVERSASGTIHNSLYEALTRADADPSLAFALSEVYAWQIDFYRLRAGDRFRVIYEEKRVGGEAIGVGRILGARIDHRGDPYYGLYFDEEGEYFDEDGDNLRKALLKTPLKFSRVSSRYQKRRFHPVQKRWKAHKGTDYAAAPGTPVYSVGDGRVVEAGYNRYNGNWVKIRHNDTYTTGYLHFSKIAEGIEPGVRVEQKQVIGYVGSTGLSTGPHLHYSFWKNGRLIDHFDEELPSAPPVADSLRPAYERLKARLLPRLQPAPAPAKHASAAQQTPSVPLGELSSVPTLFRANEGPQLPAALSLSTARP